MIYQLKSLYRFASIVAKRLESLGALTHGDRRATESRDLSQFNLDTRYGRAALDVLLRTVTGLLDPPLIPPPKDYKPGNFISGKSVMLKHDLRKIQTYEMTGFDMGCLLMRALKWFYKVFFYNIYYKNLNICRYAMLYGGCWFTVIGKWCLYN